MYLEQCWPLLWLLFSSVDSSSPLLAAKEKHIYWPCPQTDACPAPFPLSFQPKVTCQGLVFAASPVHLLTLLLFSSIFAPSSEVFWLRLPAWHTSSLPPVPAVPWALGSLQTPTPVRFAPSIFLLPFSAVHSHQPHHHLGVVSTATFLNFYPCSTAAFSPVTPPFPSVVLKTTSLESQHFDGVFTTHLMRVVSRCF